MDLYQEDAITGIAYGQSNPLPMVDGLSEEKYRDELDISTQASSFLDVAKRENWVYNLTQTKRFEREQGYELNNTSARALLESNKLNVSAENLTRLIESGSSAQTQYELELLEEERKEKEEANKNLSRGYVKAGSILGSATTPEVALSIGAGIAFKMNSIRKILGTTTALESAGAIGKLATDYTYTKEDAFIDIGLSTMIDASIVKYANRNLEQPLNRKDFEDAAPTENMLQLEYKNSQDNDFFNAYEAQRQRIIIEEQDLQKAMDNDKEFMSWYKDNQRQQAELQKQAELAEAESKEQRRYYDDLANARSKAAQYREKIRVKEAAKREQELFNQMEQEAILKKFETDPKYAPEVTNKIVKRFRQQQKELEIQASKLNRINAKIDIVKSTIKQVEDSLTTLNQKINAGHKNKGVITRWTKQRDALRNTLKQEKNKLSSPVNARIVNKEKIELRRLNSMINDSFDDVNDAAKFIRKQVSTMSKEDAKEIKQSIDLLAKNNPEFAKAKTDIENRLKPNYKYEGLSASKLTRKQKVALSALLMGGGTSALADDGSDVGLDTVLLIAFASVAGFSVASRYGMFNGDVIARAKKSLKASEFASSPKGQKAKAIKNKLFNIATTRFTSAYEPLAKESEYAKNLAQRLLFNFQGKDLPAELRKQRYMHKASYDYMFKANAEFKEWVKENNISFSHSLVNNIKLKDKFFKEIADAIEGNPSKFKSINRMAKETTKQFDEAVMIAKEAGVYGADEIKSAKNYFPRMWRKDHIQSLIKMNPENKQRIEDAISVGMQKQGMSADEANTKAKELINWFEETSPIGTSGYRDIFGKLDELLKDTVTEEDVASKLREYRDRESRLKNRIDLDLEELSDLRLIDGNGSEVTVRLDEFVKRNTFEVLESFMNSMYGAVAMAEVGFKSKSDFLRKISSNELSAKAKEDFQDIGKLIYGEPISQGRKDVLELVNAVKDLTIFAKLSLVAISMIVEVGKTMVNGGLVSSLRNAVHGLNLNRNDLLTETLIDAFPLGTSRTRNSFSLKSFDSASDDVADVGREGIISNITNTAKEATILGSGMIHMSDFLHKWNLINNATRFAKFLKNGKGLSLGRLKEYGINKETLAMFKESDFPMKNGKLQVFKYKTWSKAKQEAFSQILFRLNQEVTQEATVGSSPLFLKTDPVGKLLGTLGQYSANLFNNQGIRDARHLDGTSLTNLVMTFSGAYVSLAARNAVVGRDMDDETMVTYSLLNLPQAGLFSTGMTLLNPATIQTTKDVSEFLK